MPRKTSTTSIYVHEAEEVFERMRHKSQQRWEAFERGKQQREARIREDERETQQWEAYIREVEHKIQIWKDITRSAEREAQQREDIIRAPEDRGTQQLALETTNDQTASLDPHPASDPDLLWRIALWLVENPDQGYKIPPMVGIGAVGFFFVRGLYRHRRLSLRASLLFVFLMSVIGAAGFFFLPFYPLWCLLLAVLIISII